METENQSILNNLMSTPIKSTKDLFLGKLPLRSADRSTKLSQPTFTEESISTNNASEGAEIPRTDSKEGKSDDDTHADQESVDDAENAEAELLRKAQSEAHRAQLAEEQIQHLQFQNLTLQRSLEILAKQHEKELRLKDQEITEQRKRAQKAEEEKDAATMEFQRQKIKAEANFQTQVNQLKAELNQSKTLASSGPGAAMASGRSFSRMWMSGKSQKLQAKVQANATERDHARTVRSLQDELDRVKVELWKLSREKEQWIDIGAEKASEIANLNDENDALRKKSSLYKEKLRRYHNEIKNLKLKIEDLVLKAGWAAEELQKLTADLEYERSKHVKQSRLAVVKQTEELNRLKEEVEVLRKNTPVKEKTDKPVNSAKKSAQKAVHKEEAEPLSVRKVDPGPTLLGTETIAELVAMKARQREMRQVKMEALISKNRESRMKRESDVAEDPNKPVDLNKVFRNAIDKRRTMMNEESSILSDLTSDNSSQEGW